jgi:type I restriction enzyme, S subunit
MPSKLSRLGLCNPAFDVMPLKEMIDKNDAGSWGSDPVDVSMNVVRSTNFNDTGYLDLSDVAKRFLEPAVFDALKLEENEILIERSGGSETQPVGRVSFITKDVAEQGFAYANFIQRISVKPGIDPKYLFFCLYQMHSAGITQIMQNQTNGIRNLEYRFFLKQLLPKPEFTEQQKIASILSSVDDTIKATRISIAKLERLKKSLMQNLLTGEMKPDGTWRNREELDVFPLDIIPMRGLQLYTFKPIPKTWILVKLKSIIDLKYGAALSENSRNGGEIPVFGSSGVTGYHDEYLCEGPGIIIGRKGTVGSVKYCETNFFVIDTAYYISLKQELNWRWLYFVLSSLGLPNLNAATGVPGLSRPDAVSLFCPLPPIDEQNAIAEKLDSTINFILTKYSKITKLENLKKSLMQKLLTGRVRVK